MLKVSLSRDVLGRHTPVTITLPAARWDLLEAKAKLGVDNLDNCFFEFDPPDDLPQIDGILRKMRRGSNFINELNYFGHRIRQLGRSDRIALNGALTIHGPEDMKTLINLTHHLNDIVIGDAGEDEELGRFLVHNGMVEFPESVIPYLNFARVGRAYRATHACAFDRGRYFEDMNPEMEEVYDGHTLPEIPLEKHILTVEVTRFEDYEERIDLHLPASKDELTAALNEIGLEYDLAIVVTNADSTIALMNTFVCPYSQCTADMELGDLNELAQRISEMDDGEYIKFLAVMEYTGVVSNSRKRVTDPRIENALACAKNLDQYEFMPGVRPSQLVSGGLVSGPERPNGFLKGWSVMKRVHRITRHNSDFLSDGAGVLIEDAETLVPQEVLHWFGRCIEESPARNTLTYLARNKGEFGLMTVDEYESTYSDLSQEEIRAYVDNLAETLAADPLFEHCRMYAGHGTGIQKCDELCVFIPASTELPLAKECIRKVEEVAYQDMEQDRGPEMGGM